MASDLGFVLEQVPFASQEFAEQFYLQVLARALLAKLTALTGSAAAATTAAPATAPSVPATETPPDVPGGTRRDLRVVDPQEQVQDGTLQHEPVIHVDLDHPRVSRDGQGVAVFLPKGGHSSYLEHVTTVLKGIHDGTEAGRAMYASLDVLGLIQPVELDLRFDDAHGARLTGLHGIDRERLAALDANQVHGLHRAGLLEGVYLMLSSLYNMRRLIAEKQRRLRVQGEAEQAG